MSDEPRVWTHRIKREDHKPYWQHGAWFATVREAGVRNRPYNERRHDLSAHIEWNLLSRGFGVGATVTIGAGGGDDDLRLSLYAARLGSLWLHFGGFLPHRFRPKGWEDRQLVLQLTTHSTGWDSLHLRAALWAKEHSWSRGAPWWEQTHTIGIANLIGRSKVEREVINEGTCVVPMPEANYPATYKVERFTTRWPSRLGRFRSARVFHRTDIEPGEPVPVPGKGENSWDLDDSAIHSSSSPGQSVEEAIGALVASALRQRARYGGEHMNQPKATS